MAPGTSGQFAGGKPVGDFEHDIFPAELDEIATRRSVIGQPPIPGDDVPHVEQGLIGLALSGGGIRSATFSLGAIQALERAGVFKAVDYLSTVSGGGFIGGCVSSLMNDPAVRSNDDSFPLHAGHGADEPPAVRHVRNSGNYLAPGGLMDRLRIPAIFLRGLVLNAMALVPVLAGFTIATQAYYDYDTKGQVPAYILAGGVALFILTELGAKFFGRSRKWASRNRVEEAFSISLLILLIAGLAPSLIKLVDTARDSSPTLLWWQLTDVASRPHWGLFTVVVILALLAAAAQFSSAAARLRATLLLYGVGLSGPIVFLAAYLLMCILLIEPRWLDVKAFALDRRSSAEAIEDLQSGHALLLPIALARETPYENFPGRTTDVKLGAAELDQLYEAARVWPDDESERAEVIKALDAARVPKKLRMTFQDAEDVDEIDENARVQRLVEPETPAGIGEGSATPLVARWRLTTPDHDAFLVTAAPYDYVRIFWPLSHATENGGIEWPETAFGRLAHIESVSTAPPRWKLTSQGRRFEVQETYGRVAVSWDLGEELDRESERPADGVEPLVRRAFATKGRLPDDVHVDAAQLASLNGIWFLSVPAAARPSQRAYERTGLSTRKPYAVVRSVIRTDGTAIGYQTDLRRPFPDWPTYREEAWLTLVWILFFNTLLLSINPSAFHRFYRDRLSKAYLIRRAPRKPDARTLRDPLVSNDQQRLAALNVPGSCAPYHLINACLNLNGATDPDMRGRQGDFFLFSKHFTGSQATGYCRTADLERRDSHLNLGTAMAISGGAASPNAGSATIKPLVFLLTLLNIRMGYWLPHPGRVSLPWYAPKRLSLRLGAGSWYLLREATGTVSARKPFINVSDGAHIENLAIYQLLRRRCKVIIAIDGAADPHLLLDDLMRLVMYARVDLGAEIDLDLDGIRPLPFDGDRIGVDSAAMSRSHFALARIRYGGGEVGWLVYVKATLTGDEDPLILDYRRFHSEFPHQSTAEQFFDERRFEMYRALGFHSVHDTFNILERTDGGAGTGSQGEAESHGRPDWHDDGRREILEALRLGPPHVAPGPYGHAITR